MVTYTAFTDGGNRGGNPGRGAWGYVVYRNGEEIHRAGGYVLFPSTNNDMEYQAVVELLRWWNASRTACDGPLHIYSDSELVVRQLRGEYSVGTKLFAAHMQASKLLYLTGSSISWVPRTQNTVADSIVNEYEDEHERVLGIVIKKRHSHGKPRRKQARLSARPANGVGEGAMPL